MFVHPVYAQCYVCTDSLLISIWISALNTAVAYYMVTKIKKPILNSGYIWSIIFYLLTIAYLDISRQIKGINPIFGIDRSLLGLSIGLLISIFSIHLEFLLRHLNHGKVFFYYQKIIIPLILLIIATLFFKKLL